MKILFEKWRHKHRKAFSALRLTFIGLTIVLAVAWGFVLCWLILSYTLTFAAFALTTIGELLGSTEDLAGEPLAHVQVGEYDLTIPQRYLHDRAYGIELTSGVIFRQPIESAVEMAIPAREMVAAVPGYSSRAGFIPLNLLFNISAPSAKVLSNDLSPIFFNKLWRAEGAFLHSAIQPDPVVGLYRIYPGSYLSELSRGARPSARWVYTRFPPDPSRPVPQDPLSFWAAACETGRSYKLYIHTQEAATACHAKLFTSGLYLTIDIDGTNFHLIEPVKAFLAARIQEWMSNHEQSLGEPHAPTSSIDPSALATKTKPNGDAEPAAATRSGDGGEYFTQHTPSTGAATSLLSEDPHSDTPAHHRQPSTGAGAGIVNIGPSSEVAPGQTVQAVAFTGVQSHSWFGQVMAISADGSTLAVGAPNQDGAESSGRDSGLEHSQIRWVGAVYLYKRTRDGNWQLDACLMPDNASNHESFASSIALSADGNTLVVGAPGAKSNRWQKKNNNFTGPDGAVYLYRRHQGAWDNIQRIEIEQSYAIPHDIRFGASVGLSADGKILAVGAPTDTHSKPGIQHFAQSPLPVKHIYWSNKFSGAIYMYVWDDARWYQKAQWRLQACIKPSHVQPGDRFGESLALSQDGNTLAVGAPRGAIDAIYLDEMHQRAGAAYVFSQRAEQWHQTATLKPSDTAPGDRFGASVSLDANGRTLAIGAIRAGVVADHKFLSEKLAEQAWKKETTQTRKIQTTQNFEESATQVRERLTTQVQDRPSAQTQ
ncbi:MAG: FG-GAP repeat protein, partial [Proteobacteria bacterium]|nr:FG-GAP repeat protein [Pseudomonadota bacterium]